MNRLLYVIMIVILFCGCKQQVHTPADYMNLVDQSTAEVVREIQNTFQGVRCNGFGGGMAEGGSVSRLDRITIAFLVFYFLIIALWISQFTTDGGSCALNRPDAKIFAWKTAAYSSMHKAVLW